MIVLFEIKPVVIFMKEYMQKVILIYTLVLLTKHDICLVIPIGK